MSYWPVPPLLGAAIALAACGARTGDLPAGTDAGTGSGGGMEVDSGALDDASAEDVVAPLTCTAPMEGYLTGGSAACGYQAQKTCSDGYTFTIECNCGGTAAPRCICSAVDSMGNGPSGGPGIPYSGCPACDPHTVNGDPFALCGWHLPQ